MSTRRGRLVDLFSGMGGLGMGCEMAGFDVAVSADDRPENVATHAANFGYGASLALDLSDDRSTEIRRALGGRDADLATIGRGVDAVVGGPPCPGISRMGRRLADDPRNRLMVSFVDHVAAIGARYAVMEQVPTLISPANERLLDELRDRLRTRGYALVPPRVLRAVDFGVPQRRERVFLLIHRDDQVAPAYPQPTHSDAPDLHLRPTPTVADAFDGLPDASDHPELRERHWTRVAHPAPTTRYGRLMRGVENDADDLSYPRAWDPGLLTCSRLVAHEPASIERFLATPPGGSERVSRRHRLDPAGTALTLRAGTDERRGSHTAVSPIFTSGRRVVTVREAARLHGIPDRMAISPVQIVGYRQVGNSVPPPLAAAVAREVMRAAGLSPAAPTEVLGARAADAA